MGDTLQHQWKWPVISGPSLIGLCMLTLFVYALLVGYAIPEVSKNIGDLKVFDLRPFGYTVVDAQVLLGALGSTGRSDYLTKQIPLDMFYPGLFALTFALVLRSLLGEIGPLVSSLRRLQLDRLALWLPLLAASFDYLENVAVVVMLYQYPIMLNGVVFVASVFTMAKSLISTVVFLWIGGLVVWWIWERLMVKHNL